MRYTILGGSICAALFVGCGGEPMMACEGGGEPVDGMCPEDMEDAGRAPEEDAGDPMVDAAVPEMDAGRVEMDAGRVEMDAGRVEMDAGRVETDAGRVEVDAGMPETDAGMCTRQRFYADGDRDGFGNPAVSVELCEAPSGFVTDATDCDDTCAGCYPGNGEVCDGENNDCDGMIDEGVMTTFYRDFDRDGHGSPTESTEACSIPIGFTTNTDDCDDTCAACYPGSDEVCDGEDNDCDEVIDDGVLTTFYRDQDGDGHGEPSDVREACAQPAGYARVGDDCDDSCSACYPGHLEVCDGEDNNCNSTVDEGVLTTFYRDQDGDAHGVSSVTTMACTRPAGYATVGGDCDDACGTCFPGNAEACDTLDNNCNGTADEGVRITYYRDADMDGYGLTSSTTQACSVPAGYSATSGDCNDTCATCYPGRAEVCDGNDNNCNTTIDEGVRLTFYRDADSDGYGVTSMTSLSCAPAPGYVAMGGDCNDACATCYPGRAEVCDGNDNNCNAMIDEGVTTTFYRDSDNDGHGAPGMTMIACTMPAGYVTSNDDCNDIAMSIHPGATEVCNATDDNCSGVPDESFACVRGTSVSCTTTCGSTGTGSCTNSCAIPSGASCVPPAETCNGVDDDCDGTADEQLFAFGAPRVDTYSADFARPEAFAFGTSLYSFWHAAGTVSAWRHTLDGAPTTTVQVPLGGTANYDAGVGSTGVVAWAYITATGNVVVQRLDRTTLLAAWSTTIPINASQVQIAVGSSHIFVFTIEASGNIYRRRLGINSGGISSGAELLGDSSSSFAVAGDGVDRQILAYRDPFVISNIHTLVMQGDTTSSVLISRTHTAPNNVDDLAIASPWIGADPEILVAYTTIGGGASGYNTRYLSYRASSTATGVITAQTNANGAPPERSRLDLEYANNTYLFAGPLTTTFPATANGIPVAAQLNTRPGSAVMDVRVITAPLPSALHESISVVRYPDSVAQPDRLFYNPSANGIASIPIGCF
jgi:hypothetical protein